MYGESLGVRFEIKSDFNGDIRRWMAANRFNLGGLFHDLRAFYEDNSIVDESYRIKYLDQDGDWVLLFNDASVALATEAAVNHQSSVLRVKIERKKSLPRYFAPNPIKNNINNSAISVVESNGTAEIGERKKSSDDVETIGETAMEVEEGKAKEDKKLVKKLEKELCKLEKKEKAERKEKEKKRKEKKKMEKEKKKKKREKEKKKKEAEARKDNEGLNELKPNDRARLEIEKRVRLEREKAESAEKERKEAEKRERLEKSPKEPAGQLNSTKLLNHSVNSGSSLNWKQLESEEDDSDVGVIYSDVVIRAPTRPTMESWANTGWRVGREKKAQAKRKRKKRRLNEPGEEQQIAANNHQSEAQGSSQYSDAYFESLPDLAEPRVSDSIAYKVLEVSARWEPVISGWKVAAIISMDDSGLELAITHETLEAVDEEDDLNAFARAMFEEQEGEGLEAKKVVTLAFSDLMTPKLVQRI